MGAALGTEAGLAQHGPREPAAMSVRPEHDQSFLVPDHDAFSFCFFLDVKIMFRQLRVHVVTPFGKVFWQQAPCRRGNAENLLTL